MCQYLGESLLHLKFGRIQKKLKNTLTNNQKDVFKEMLEDAKTGEQYLFQYDV